MSGRPGLEVAERAPGALLDLGFVRRGGRTIIDRRRFAWPFVITRSFYVDPDWSDRLSIIVQSGSGAVHGGDVLGQRLTLGTGTSVCMTNQGATAVHRARSGYATEHVTLELADGASLAYLPEPRILFPAAALRQTVELDCAAGATALVIDGFTLHDPAGGDGVFREFDSTFRLRRASEELVVDRTRLVNPDPALFRGHRAFGSAMLIVSRVMDIAALQHRLMATIERAPGVYGAASLMPADAGIGLRLAAPELRMIRWVFGEIAEVYRDAVLSARRAEPAVARPRAAARA